MTTRTLAVLSGGLGHPSSTRLLADQLATATHQALLGRGAEASIDTVELRDHAHDVTNTALTGVPTGTLGSAMDTVSAADGLIVVTPIFNASYSGLFKTFFDVLEPGTLTAKPVLIAATGGTPRHSLALEHALRPMFTYLRAVVAPTAVYAASEDWGSADTRDRIARAAGELAALLDHRSAPAPADPFAEPIPFEQLLGGDESATDRGAVAQPHNHVVTPVACDDT